ncbi:MAG TPA: hypothetical protein VMA32_11570 [Streptosporangiaceae bacterium]|nr:hypothetical protein [Streptosporangiaceae bacterium]
MIGVAEISSLATGAGTLVLAFATFASVRSANRAARVAERALMVNQRPLLVPSHMSDTRQKIFFQEGRSMVLEGGRGGADFDNGVVYLGISIRNAGPGIAVLHGWRFMAGTQINPPRPELETFRHQGRDILVAPDDVGFWQGAFRDSDDSQYDEAVAAVKSDDDEVALTIDLLYGDNDGGQRVISRMMLRGYKRDQESARQWIASVVRHWNVDRPDPR